MKIFQGYLTDDNRAKLKKLMKKYKLDSEAAVIRMLIEKAK